ncbi:lachesin-like isoform X1 [Biomphalaria glabrata]
MKDRREGEKKGEGESIMNWETVIATSEMADKGTSVTMTAANMHPKLNTTTEHLTVVEGGRATLPCTVQSMGDQVVFESEYQVIWISPKKTVISMGDRRLMDDQRMSVERPYISIWNLLIRNIRHNDTGYYECRINTSPVQTKKVYLDVKVPPAIVSQMSSDRIVLEEGQTATLVCNVTGIPQPNVTWYKRNHKGTSNIKEKIGSEGEVLIIHNVSRNCDDIYECYVDNGVPPAVSKAIRVVVNYAPEVHLQHPKRLGQYSGKETVLDCLIQANPLAVTDWLVNGQKITKSDKYDIEIFKNEVENRLNLALRIRDISPSEFGMYECFASNFLGEDKEEMFLFELTSTSTTTTTSSTAAADTTVSRKQPPHNNRPGDQKSAEHSRPNYNNIDGPDNQPNVTPANSKSIAIDNSWRGNGSSSSFAHKLLYYLPLLWLLALVLH